MKYENQEAFILSAKRVKARIARAKELKINQLSSEELAALVENLSLAKAISSEKTVEECTRGQEYYVQTLLDSLSMPIHELVDAEYEQATMELGTEAEILSSLGELQTV